MKSADVVVIGGGPGGYVCGIRATQLGLKTVLVERDRLGGECLNYGCIPSKSLITVSKLFEKVRNGAKYGLKVDAVSIDFVALQKWKSEVVSKLVSGVGALLSGNGVEVLKGDAELVDKNNVKVVTTAGIEQIHTKSIVIATGTRPVSIPGLTIDREMIITSKEALDLDRAPERFLIVGGGAIGLEFASMYQKFGSLVTVVELTDQLLPGTDIDSVRVVQRSLENHGVKILLKSKVASTEKSTAQVKATIETPSGTTSIEADKILVSVGRKANTEKLNLSAIGVELDQRGYIKVDEHMMTNVAGIYAIGDVRGPPLLAHKASKEGIVAAESIAGKPTAADWKVIPDAIFTDPEIASAGLTESKAIEAGYSVKRSRFPFAALGRALSVGETEGFVKIISNAQDGLVLGVQIVGPEASNLISEIALAIEMGATVEDIALTVHPHPTFPEAIMEAAESAAGHPVHQLKS
ncbi:MAG: dihydrolipoyl dehydrogenase [Thaumarchaeota archaeon]|nr:dihydrolipoyl dehydrogenase [Nitrososphaerota archaeon]